jgi:hypothetical protein
VVKGKGGKQLLFACWRGWTGGDGGIRQLVYNLALGQDSNVGFLCSALSSYPLVLLGIFGYSNQVF